MIIRSSSRSRSASLGSPGTTLAPACKLLAAAAMVRAVADHAGEIAIEYSIRGLAVGRTAS
jgi:hypothetical protein